MNVAVIGAGSWGTALAQLLGSAGHEVSLWAHRAEVALAINKLHYNPRYLSTHELHPAVLATDSLADALKAAQAALLVVPSNLVRSIAQDIAALNAVTPCVSPDMPILVCSKGVEAQTGDLLVDIVAQELGNKDRLAVLSGPNHAEEVVDGLPSATVIASSSPQTATFFQNLCATSRFRPYVSEDVCGVSLCGAFKNVIAIAVGVSYGMGLGDNTAAALMTRGQAEMSRLVCAAGGRALTCMGLAGTGDLIVTCMSGHSRNRSFGEALAQGETIEAYRERTHMVVEGAFACQTLDVLARRHKVELPITNAVRALVWEGMCLGEQRDTLIETLLGRPLTSEF